MTFNKNYMAIAPIILAIQLLGLAVLIFVDIGFDHPGSYGFDFDHLILIALAEIISFITIGLLSLKNRKKTMITASGCIIIAGFLIICWQDATA